jgi:hypothetical protein
MKIRKQFDELTLDDVRRFPVWEFALDDGGEEEQDEETERPWKISGPLDPSDGMFSVRASFTLADGTKMNGCSTPPLPGDLGTTLHKKAKPFAGEGTPVYLDVEGLPPVKGRIFHRPLP